LKTEINNNHATDYERHYYCKNDNCIEIKSFTPFFFIEFLENNKIKRYILNTCIYDENNNKIRNCKNIYNLSSINDTHHVDLSCTKDSDYLYNKCINNYCVFSEDSSVTHCDYVHKGFAMFQRTYFHCGKTYNDVCEYNNECSSASCSNNLCCDDYYVPSDSTYLEQQIETIIFCAIVGVLLSVCCCVCMLIYMHKHNQKTKNLEINKD